jgi:hypothetical protein
MNSGNQNAKPQGDLVCFVIGPIGDKLGEPGSPERSRYEEAVEVLEDIIEPACAGFALRVLRADRITTTGEIPDQIFRHLRDSYLVIADLTDANPNVMYELGLRHTTGKLTIQIGEKSRLPFDVATIRTIMFTRTENGFIQARRQLSTMISAGLDSGGDPVAATRIWFERRLGIGELAELDADEEDAPGFLDLLGDFEAGMNAALANMNAMPDVMESITKLVQEAANDMDVMNAGSGTSSGRIYITNRLASSLDEPVSRFEVLAGEFKQSIDQMHPGANLLLRVATDVGSSDETLTFKHTIIQMYDVATETFQSLRAFRESVRHVGEATPEFRRVTKRIIKCLDDILETEEYIEQWSNQAALLPY